MLCAPSRKTPIPVPAKPVRAIPARTPAATALRALALQQPFGPLQTKLVVGPAHDHFEAEADRVADQVSQARDAAASGPLAAAPTISRLPAGDEAGSTVRRQTEDEEEHAQTSRVQRKKEDEDEKAKTQRAQRAVVAATADVTGAPPVEEEKEEKKTAQKRGAPGGEPAVGAEGGAVDGALEAQVSRARVRGTELPAGTRSAMESGLGRDLAAVRVHADAEADRLNRALGARAFTSGHDVFFARGAYAPETAEGRRLLAHELTHVVQQTGGTALAQTERIQRASKESGLSDSADSEDNPSSTRVFEGDVPGVGAAWIKLGDAGPDKVGTFRVPTLRLPKIPGGPKGAADNTVVPGVPAKSLNAIRKGARFTYKGASTRQGLAWEKWLAGAARDPAMSSGIRAAVDKRFKNDSHRLKHESDAGEPIFYLAGRQESSKTLVLGTTAQIAANPAILMPSFDKTGAAHEFDADHIMEIQFGGLDGYSNLWLWDRRLNQQVGGPGITKDIDKDLRAIIKAASDQHVWGKGTKLHQPSPKEVRDNWRIVYAKVVEGDAHERERDYWTQKELQDGLQLEQLQALGDEDLVKRGLQLKKGGRLPRLNIFAHREGGEVRYLKLEASGGAPKDLKLNEGFVRGLTDARISYNNPQDIETDRKVGEVTGIPRRKSKSKSGASASKGEKRVTLPLRQNKALLFGVYIGTDRLAKDLDKTDIPGSSPLHVESAEISDQWEVVARGRLMATKFLFAGLPLPVVLRGDAVLIQFPIPSDRLKFGPFRVTSADLELGADDDGLFLGGAADFEIRGLGSGRVEARGLDLEGTFNFDFDVLQPAEVRVAYQGDTWSASATLGVKTGALAGIKSGQVNVNVSGDQFSFDGTLTIDFPGVQAGATITVAYSRERGLTIGGTVPLNTSAIPGIREGVITVTVSRRPDGTWDVAGTGTAQIAIPGVNGTLEVAWADGALRVAGAATVEKGNLTGNLNFTVTNQPLDDQGQPIKGPPRKQFAAWGSGEATIRFGRFLTGTAGLTITRDGQLQILGRVALPPVVEVFPAKVYEKTLFEPPELRIPIVGITVGSHSVGIFAFLRGRLGFRAQVGPGVLRDTAVQVDYNPSRPEQAHIAGGSRFEVGAEAGLNLAITGGIGAGLAIVDATGEAGIEGSLGVVAKAAAQVGIDWTPMKGLALSADLSAEARPKFDLSLIAAVRVTARLFIADFTLYEKSWRRPLASFGPDIVFGVALPVRWSEQQGLDLSLDKIRLTVPDIDVVALGRSAFAAITG